VWGVDRVATVNSTTGKVEVPIFSVECDGVIYAFYRHEEFFVSQDVKIWYDSYLLKDFTTSTDYINSNYLWFDALHHFNSGLIQNGNEKRKY